MNILFATSELFPLIKTGGLADVSSSLPQALQGLGHSVTVILPGYRSVQGQLGEPDKRYQLDDPFLRFDVCIAEYPNSALGFPLLLVESASLFDRDGGPYVDSNSEDWLDNADRFSQFCRAVVALLNNRSDNLKQRFDVVHCNDWQTGLIPALLHHNHVAIQTVFTIHNMAYQGVFDQYTFSHLQLPDDWWHFDKLEFYGNFSFLKAGIVFSRWVTTVSPTYAQEILQEPEGCGLAGLLQHNQHKLVGILNGADYQIWNPTTDPNVVFPFDQESLSDKIKNKLDLQRRAGLRLSKSTPLIGVVSRLVEQKGVDWLLDTIEALQGEKVQWIILGSGDMQYQARLLELAQQHPKTISVSVRYDEALAHRIEAGCDLFAMPSRYEPCGLNQIYSLRYGTLPIVRSTGGLADTVVNASEEAIKQGTATGFVFQQPNAAGLIDATRQAIGLYSKRKTWQKIQHTAMNQCFDWQHSAQSYLELYHQE